MACCLFSTKPFPEPIMVDCQLDAWNKFQWNLDWNFIIFFQENDSIMSSATIVAISFRVRWVVKGVCLWIVEIKGMHGCVWVGKPAQVMGLFHHQVVSSHGIDYVGFKFPYFPWGKFYWPYHPKYWEMTICKYMLCFLKDKKHWCIKGLVICIHAVTTGICVLHTKHQLYIVINYNAFTLVIGHLGLRTSLFT